MPLLALSIALLDDERLRRRRLTEILRSLTIVGKVKSYSSRTEIGEVSAEGEVEHFDFLVSGREKNASALEILTSSREKASTVPPAIILLTAAEVGTPYVAQLYSAGAVAFLSEPFSSDGVANPLPH